MSEEAHTTAENKIAQIYGEHIMCNDGTHIISTIQDDRVWQKYWREIVNLPNRKYNLPKNSTGKKFIHLLNTEINNIIERKSNSEKLIVFLTVILQKSKSITKSKDVKALLERRMTDWQNEQYDTVVKSALFASNTYKLSDKKSQSPDQIARVFQRLLLQGKIREATNYVLNTTRKGGKLEPESIDPKTGLDVKTVLELKHPPSSEPSNIAMEEYDSLPALIDVDISEETVLNVAKKLKGSGGPGGTDYAAMQNWLLRYGHISENLRESISRLTNWIANTIVPFEAIRALVANRLVALDKCPGVRPVGIGEILRRLCSKCLLEACGEDVTEKCGRHQLCSGLRAGIEGGIHAMQELFVENQHEEDWGILLVDAANGFNALNRKAMLWNVRHLWPRGARFTFNCYKHWPQLVLQRTGETLPYILHSREGVTQGDPLSMYIYALALLPLVNKLEDKTVGNQIWYADDSGIAGNLTNIQKWLDLLCTIGPGYGYFPEPEKCILVSNINPRTEEFKEKNNLKKVVTGYRYLGGPLGTQEYTENFVQDKLAEWKKELESFVPIARLVPHEAYTAITKSLKHRWTFNLRTTQVDPEKCRELDEYITGPLLDALLRTQVDDTTRNLSNLKTKNGGIGLPHLHTTAQTQYKTSKMATEHLVKKITGREELCGITHYKAGSEAKKYNKMRTEESEKLRYQETVKGLPNTRKRIIERAPLTGIWMSQYPGIYNGNILSPVEFRDSILTRYGETPEKLHTHCDGCGKKSSLDHLLTCKTGGLVHLAHDELRDELANLCKQAYVPNAVQLEPPIQNNADSTTENYTQDRGDIGIRGFWAKQFDCIVDIRITYPESNSYRNSTLEKLLEKQEKEKKKKYLLPCLERRRHFTPFIATTDGVLGKEAQKFTARLVTHLAGKWKSPYSQVMAYVRGKISIAILRGTSRRIRGTRTPFHLKSYCEDGAGINLFAHRSEH